MGQSFVLCKCGADVIAFPYLMKECWERPEIEIINQDPPELPREAKCCWEDYCQLPMERCFFRKRNPRLQDLDISGFQLLEVDTEEPTVFENLFPGRHGLLIKRVVFPPAEEISLFCPLLPEGIPSSLEHFVIFNPSGISRCWDVAKARRLSCGSCKATA